MLKLAVHYLKSTMEKPTNSIEQKIKASNRPQLPWWKKLLLLVLLIGLGIAIYYIYFGQIIEVLSVLTVIFLVIGIVLVFAYLVSQDLFLWLIGRRSEYQKLIGTSRMVAIGLSKAAINYAPLGLNIEEKERLKEDVPVFLQMRFMTGINNFIARIFIGAFAAAFGLLGTVVLMKQNEKLEVQINIEEATRRSSLVFLMSNIMDKVDEELKDTFNTNHNTRKLTPQTIGRIAALSQSLKPYYYLQDGQLIKQPLSPERGQLLLNLLNSKLDTITYKQIYKQTTFQFSALQNAKMENADLRNVDLRNANLRYTGLGNTNFGDANLRDADFRDTNLSDADLQNADLQNADFRNANLRNVDFCNADLRNIYLRKADLHNADFGDANLGDADLFKANLHNVDLSNANLYGADLRGAKKLTKYSFTLAKTLYECQFPSSLKTQIEELKQEKPCLFTKKGCE